MLNAIEQQLFRRDGNVLALNILQAGSFATQRTQVIKLGAAHFGRAHYVNLVHDFRTLGEDALYALAEADLTDGEAGLGTATASNHDALERLQALLVAFFNLHLHANGVAG